jgi:hypothetical protein
MTMITTAQRRIIKDRAEIRNCKYRITIAGEVHFYGRMPNSNVTGWYLFAGSVREAISENLA